MDGRRGVMKQLGNTALVNEGIQTEKSLLRAHVCPVVKRVYIFERAMGVKAIETKRYKERQTRTNGIITAVGYLVPPLDIEGCIEIEGKPEWWPIFKPNLSTSDKGFLAMRMVRAMLIERMIPLSFNIPLNVLEITDQDLQINGVDIIVKTSITIQTKCDYKGGSKHLGGTGNLFLQTKECNPYRQY